MSAPLPAQLAVPMQSLGIETWRLCLEAAVAQPVPVGFSDSECIQCEVNSLLFADLEHPALSSRRYCTLLRFLNNEFYPGRSWTGFPVLP